jgi:hypothetical protein
MRRLLLLAVLFLAVQVRSQVVTGPTNATATAIPTFQDATGKKIINNPDLTFTNSTLQVNGSIPIVLLSSSRTNTGVGAEFTWKGSNSTPQSVSYGGINVHFDNRTAGSESSHLTFDVKTNGSIFNPFSLWGDGGHFTGIAVTNDATIGGNSAVTGNSTVGGTEAVSGTFSASLVISSNAVRGTIGQFTNQIIGAGGAFNVDSSGNITAASGLQLNGSAIITNLLEVDSLTPQSLLRSDTLNRVRSANIGNGLVFDGLTLSADGGSPVNNFTVTNIFIQNGKGNVMNITNAITLGGEYVYPIKAGANITLTTNSNAGGGTNITIAAAAGGLATSASQYSIVGGGATGDANWQSLSNAYLTAKSALPNGNALSGANQYTIFLLPGVYDFGTNTLSIDTSYINIVGLSPNTGPYDYALWNGMSKVDKGDTILTSQNDVIKLTGSSNTNSLINLYLDCSTVGSGGSSGNPTVYCLDSANNIGKGLFVGNVVMVNSACATCTPMVFNKNYGGTFIDVRSWTGSSVKGSFGSVFNGTAIASGTFVRCKAVGDAFGGSSEGFGGTGTASGLFIDCEAEGGFGKDTASGTFIRCRVNVTASVGSGRAFGYESGATASGTFIECSVPGDSRCFGYAGTMSGTMRYCDTATFPGWTTRSGTVESCSFAGIYYNYNLSKVIAGTSTGLAVQGGTLKVNTTTTGNGADTTEDNLITFSVPANTLTVNGDHLEFDVAGSFANSTDNKQLKVKWGATTIFDTGSLNGATLGASSWRAHGKIIRTGSATQKCTTEFTLSGALLGALTTTTTTYATAAETLSSASTFKCTGQNLSASTANAVVQEIEVLHWFPAN